MTYNPNSRIAKVFLEAEGNFTSIVKSANSFDPSKPDLDMFNDENTETKNEDKDKLTRLAIDKITQSLEVSDELQSILNQIKKINSENGSGEWKINEEGNTATLRNKNARIFKQNNNICLSYNDKVELFKSVPELHAWLKSHNMPLPEGIQLHETVNGKKIGFNIKSDSPWYNILNNKTTDAGLQLGDTIPWTKEDSDELKLQNRKPVTKMGQAAYKQAMRFMDKKEKDEPKIKDFPESIEEDNQLNADNIWYLAYQDNNYDDTLYLNSSWQEGNLLTNNLEEAARFLSREAAMNEAKNVYMINNTDAPFKPIQNSDLNECFGGGVTSAALGAAVQYNGEKKEESLDESLNEETLEEMKGFPGTPFENVNYTKKIDRAKEYLDWLGKKDEYGRYNYSKDPNAEEHEKEAINDYNRDTMIIAVTDKWSKLFKKHLHPITGKPLDKEAFRTYILKDINPKYGLDLNPDEDMVTKVRKADHGVKYPELKPEDYAVKSQHNADQYYAFDKWFRDNMYAEPQSPSWKAPLEQAKQDYFNSINNPTQTVSIDKTDGILNTLTTQIDNGLPDQDFMTEVMKYKSQLNGEEFNKLIDKLVNASKQGKLDMNPAFEISLPYLKVNTQTESTFAEEFKKLINKDKETSLKEEDTPGDFATGSQTPDISTNKVDIKQTSPEAPETTDSPSDIGIDSPEGNSNPMANFGDINIGGGGYSPEEPEQAAAPMPPEPEYQIIDVLINDQDDTDIKVKIKNMETGQVETKNLNEIDI